MRASHSSRLLPVTAVALGLLTACDPGDTGAGGGGSGAGTTTTFATGGGATTSEGGAGGTTATTAGSGGTGGVGGGGTGGVGGGGTGGGAPESVVLSAEPGSTHEFRTDLKIGALGLVVVTWVAHPAGQPSTLGFAFSMDDGLTFTPIGHIESPDGRSADHPTLAITKQNDVYLSWLGVGPGGPTDAHVYVSRAPFGQTTFDPPVQITTPETDVSYEKPRIAVTAQDIPVAVYEKRHFGLHQAVASRSLDSGDTWTSVILPVDDILNDMAERPYPCMMAPDATGPFRVAYLRKTEIDDAAGPQVVETPDNGATWVYAEYTGVSNPSRIAPRCVSLGAGEHWVTYGAHSSLSVEPLLPAESSAIWSHHYPLASDYHTLDKQDLPLHYSFAEIALDDSGALNLAFYTAPEPGSPLGAFRVHGADGELLPIVPDGVLQKPNLFDLTPDSPTWLGDYAGFARRGNLLFASHVDNSSGASHVVFHRISL